MAYRILIIFFCAIFIGCSGEKIGTITEEVGVYDTDSKNMLNEKTKEKVRLPAGAKVKLVNKDGCPTKDGSEKMALIMIRNEMGDFVEGYKVCVPERKIKWD